MDFAILIHKNHPHEIDTLAIFHTAKWVRNDAHNVPFLVLFDWMISNLRHQWMMKLS